MVQADNSIALYIDNQLVEVIPSDGIDAEIHPKTNDFTVSTQNVHKIIKLCIRYMVEMQNLNQALTDYWFYNNKMKSELKKQPNYDDIMKNWKLKHVPYGLNYRTNKAGQKEIQRDPTSVHSIFDNHCFIFYLVKYCEIVGIEAVIASQHQIGYSQKRRVIEFVIKNECDLGVEELSWKHCLFYMFLNGVISEEDFQKEFIDG